MKKHKILIVLLPFLFGACEKQVPEKSKLSAEIRAFSGYWYISRDQELKLSASIFLFNQDTLLSMRTDSLLRFVCKKTVLNSVQIDSINYIIEQIRFKNLKGNSSFELLRQSSVLYCSLHFGFIDSLGKPEAYVPADKYLYTFKPSHKLIEYLTKIKGTVTTDSVTISKYMREIIEQQKIHRPLMIQKTSP